MIKALKAYSKIYYEASKISFHEYRLWNWIEFVYLYFYNLPSGVAYKMKNPHKQ